MLATADKEAPQRTSYDLYLWTAKAFNTDLVRRVAVLKAWTDQRRRPSFEPVSFLDLIQPRNLRWEDLNGLVPRRQHQDRAKICHRVRERFASLAALTDDEEELLQDQASHRQVNLYHQLRSQALAKTNSQLHTGFVP